MKTKTRPGFIATSDIAISNIREPEADRMRRAIQNKRPRSEDPTIQRIASLIREARRDPETRMFHIMDALKLLEKVPDMDERTDLALKLKETAKLSLSNPEGKHYRHAVEAIKICDEVIYQRIDVDKMLVSVQS